MKKTLIALMALAGVACGAQDFVIPTAENFYAGDYTFSFVINENDVIYNADQQITGLTNGNVLAIYYGAFSGDQYYTNGVFFSVSEGAITLSVGRGSLANAWDAATSTPILKSDTSYTISTDGVSGGMFVDGSSNSITIEIGKTYTITNTVNTAATTNNQSVSLWVEGNDTALATVNYKGNMHGGNKNTKITSMFNATYAVPEPATATLSLLALAGLAARRRRKRF